MEKWEYLCVSISLMDGSDDAANRITSRLNYYGAQGWELVCVYGIRYYFKRRKA